MTFVTPSLREIAQLAGVICLFCAGLSVKGNRLHYGWLGLAFWALSLVSIR